MYVGFVLLMDKACKGNDGTAYESLLLCRVRIGCHNATTVTRERQSDTEYIVYVYRLSWVNRLS
jgi:hypothetical protein